MKKTNLLLSAALVCLAFIVGGFINVSAEPPPGKGNNKKFYSIDIPQTGQTNLYAIGDDGDLQMGVAWPDPRFSDNEDGTVTDNLTGLIWLKNANCPNGEIMWSDALTFADSLYDGWTGDGSGEDCGLSDGTLAGDWRLPNVRELHSLIDFGNHNPALPPGHPFTDLQQQYYWSSTTYAGYEGTAWNVHIYHGYVFSSNKNSTIHYVWPVRGGQ
jgi:hypothetical protein